MYVAGDAAAGRRGRAGAAPPSSRACARRRALLLQATAAAGIAGVGFHAYGVQPQHGRLVQLEPEHPERAADAGAALLHRRRAGRARGAAADGGARRPNERGLPQPLTRPTMSWTNGTRRRGTTRPGRSSRSGCTRCRRGGSSARPSGTLAQAICDRLIPQPDRPDDPVPIVPFIDEKLHENQGDGYRYESMPPHARGLAARPARDRRGGARPLAARLSRAAATISRTRCCARCSTATRVSDAWQGMPAKRFFKSVLLQRGGRRLLRAPGGLERDRLRRPGLAARLCPAAASNRRDPWEAMEEADEDER